MWLPVWGIDERHNFIELLAYSEVAVQKHRFWGPPPAFRAQVLLSVLPIGHRMPRALCSPSQHVLIDGWSSRGFSSKKLIQHRFENVLWNLVVVCYVHKWNIPTFKTNWRVFKAEYMSFQWARSGIIALHQSYNRVMYSYNLDQLTSCLFTLLLCHIYSQFQFLISQHIIFSCLFQDAINFSLAEKSILKKQLSIHGVVLVYFAGGGIPEYLQPRGYYFTPSAK